MNKVITINLNGVAYQLEEGGYEALREYLDNAARRLEGNPDKDEIIADIEQAIADKFRVLLGAFKTVISTREVAAVITEMGPVQDDSGPAPQPAGEAGEARPAGETASGGAGEPLPSARRLFKIHDGAMIAGVCNGLAAYLGVDVTIVRVAFALLAAIWGTGVLIYIALAFIMPSARTPAEKAAAAGAAATAQEFIRRAKAGYYEGFRTFHDRRAHREWKRKFKQEMRGWKYNFQRQMHENAQQWQQGGQHPRAMVGMGFTLLILKWVRFLCFCLAGYAVYTLVTRGSVFGMPLPVDIPAWLGVVCVFVAYQVIVWPIKAMRHSYCCPGMPAWGGRPMSGPLDGLVWLAFFAGLVWLADHNSPSFHEWLMNLPPQIHHFLDSVREWWARR